MTQHHELADHDYATIRGVYGYLNVTPLTVQEETFLLNYLRNMSVTASAKAAGMAPAKARELLARDGMDKIQDYFRHQMMQGIRFDLETATSMYLEAHRKSMNATEEIKATDSLAKLHMLGGFAPVQLIVKDREADKEQGRDVTPPKSTKMLEQMDEAALMRLAAMSGLDSLDPEPDGGEEHVSAEPVWELVDE